MKALKNIWCPGCKKLLGPNDLHDHSKKAPEEL